MTSFLDDTDRKLIATLRRSPRASITELARRVLLARGTVQVRLRRLEDSGVIRGYGPDIDPAAAGFDVRAYTTLAIAQGAHDRVVDRLTEIGEIVEIHTVTGGGDMLLHIIAGSNDHLHDVLQRVARLPEIRRTETHLALATPVQRTVADLIAESVG